MWEVLFDDEFEVEFDSLEEAVRQAILNKAGFLERFGPSLGRPHVDTLKGSSLSNLKELRVQCGGVPWRVLFAFDPKRRAILLVGGNKAGDKRWYKGAIRTAEDRYRRNWSDA